MKELYFYGRGRVSFEKFCHYTYSVCISYTNFSLVKTFAVERLSIYNSPHLQREDQKPLRNVLLSYYGLKDEKKRIGALKLQVIQ